MIINLNFAITSKFVQVVMFYIILQFAEHFSCDCEKYLAISFKLKNFRAL